MNSYLTNNINLPLDVDTSNCIDIVAKHLRVKVRDIVSMSLHKLSIDGRKRDNIHYVASYIVVTEAVPSNCTVYTPPIDVFDMSTNISDKHVVVVGSGSAGLMCANLLSNNGVKVTVIERGSDIDKRRADVNRFWQHGQLDINSNVQFGLGGAGTFSDGKLTTGTSSPLIYSVFKQLVNCGAPQEIMYSNLPHIGTDKLVDVVANMRDNIIANGGKFLFDSLVVDIIVDDGMAKGVVVTDTTTREEYNVMCDDIVLAIGHSARDSYQMLVDKLEVKPKAFAVGVRIEHDRQFISRARYGQLANTHRDLMSASYKLATTLPSGRSCYSFCMCPGGIVVPASSQIGTVVVNGMSYYDRMEDNSNSALVVGVKVEDYYNGDVLDGVRFIEELERTAYNCNNDNSYRVPAQNVVDFLAKRTSTELALQSSYILGHKLVNLWDILPSFVSESIAQALVQFDKNMAGFGSSGILLAVESRTSSPITIVRDKVTLASTRISNVYPIGEGAGYAGGIVSSGVDGLKIACKLLDIDY